MHTRNLRRLGLAIGPAAVLCAAAGAAGQAGSIDRFAKTGPRNAPGDSHCDCQWTHEVEFISDSRRRIKLYANFLDGLYAWAAAGLDVQAPGVEWTDADLSCGIGDAPGTSAGVLSGDVVSGVLAGQLHLPDAGVLADPANPALVWCGELVIDCDGFPQIVELNTVTDFFEYYPNIDTSERLACTPGEVRGTFLMCPLDIEGLWEAVPLADTLAEIEGRSLLLSQPVGSMAPIAASIKDRDLDWGEPGTTFGISTSLGELTVDASLGINFFTLLRCRGDLPSFGIVMTLHEEAARVLLVSADFEEITAEPVGVRLYRDGDVVGVGRLAQGETMRIAGLDEAVNVAASPTELSVRSADRSPAQAWTVALPGQPLVEVDRVRLLSGLDPQEGVAIDRAQVLATGTPVVRILHAGDPPRPCRADLDGSGSLDIFDFLVFQNLFARGDLRADFDGNGQLDIFDFLAFQNAFATGCP